MKNKLIKAIISILILLLIIFFAYKYQLIFVIIVVSLISIFIIYLRTPKGKGFIGELVISKFILGKNKPNKNKYIINNLLFNDTEKSVQIDHILINENGINVIETKNYSGYIYGNEKSYEWTQVLSYGKIKNKIYNPLMQNENHIKSIKKILKGDFKYNNYICFTARATLKNKIPNVYYPMELKRKIKKLQKIEEPVLSKDQIDYIYQELLKRKESNKITLKQHVKSIEERRKNNEFRK